MRKLNIITRDFSTNADGNSFDNYTINQVWEKAIIVPGYNPSMYRKDICGNWMQFSEYGNTKSMYGWEIDHIYPASKGGNDSLLNLQPLYWLNNRKKSDHYPWYCSA